MQRIMTFINFIAANYIKRVHIAIRIREGKKKFWIRMQIQVVDSES